MAIGIPRLLGEVHDKDTQFTAAMKQNQELVFLGGLVVIALIGYLIYASMPNTREGTWRYAICKTFLERYSQYPTELKILTVAEKQNSAQIGYLTINSYGSQESALMECFYNTDQRGVSISRVTLDRKPLVFSTKTTGVKNDKTPAKMDKDQFMEIFNKGRQDMTTQIYSEVTLKEFNKTIGTIMSRKEDMDLTIPGHLANTIKDLKFAN